MNKLIAKPFYSKEYNCTMYMLSVEGGPQDLLARTTEAAALTAGAAYVKANYPHLAVLVPVEGMWPG
jgi:hypothetical protein